jgi:hypothetical protein
MADIDSHSVHDNHDLDDQTPQAIVTGETPDISLFAEFTFYQWIWFDQDVAMAEDQEKYGRYLGPSRDVGSLMTSKILNDKGNTLYRLTFRALTQDKLDSQKEKALQDKFDKDVVVCCLEMHLIQGTPLSISFMRTMRLARLRQLTEMIMMRMPLACT